jgi:hypothetical protein
MPESEEGRKAKKNGKGSKHARLFSYLSNPPPRKVIEGVQVSFTDISSDGVKMSFTDKSSDSLQ